MAGHNTAFRLSDLPDRGHAVTEYEQYSNAEDRGHGVRGMHYIVSENHY